ncbi:MAG: cytochrome c oxidase assembly protein, partial [Actinomycetes bacterium]
LVAALVGLGLYVARVIQPTAVAAGAPPLTTRQRTWFIVGVVVFWLAADYPMHDIAEERLYLVHMFQHVLLTFVLPPVMLLATPEWLARLMLGDGRLKRFVYWWARPAPALLVNAGLVALSHWAWVVNSSISNGWLHYGVHTLLVLSAFLVWIPICGPIPELQVTPPTKMLMLFLTSIIPTIPAAFLTTAEGVLYQGYDRSPRLWGLSVQYDQQLAGIVMKVIAGFYLWGIIAFIFFRWSLGERDHRTKYRGRLVPTPPDTEAPADAVPSAPRSQ